MSDRLKFKMNSYEAVPPESSWQAISERLHEPSPATNVLAEKFNVYEVAPPEAAWQQIVNGLQEESTAPAKIKRIHPARWLAAAAIMGALLTGAYYYINGGNAEIEQRTATAPVISPEVEPATTVTPQVSIQEKDRATSSTLAALYPVVTPKKEAGSTIERPLRSISIDEDDIEPIAQEQTIAINPRKILNEKGELIQDMSVVNPQNNKYISITAPNGQQTKISSKLAIAMRYLSTATNVDQYSTTETDNWKKLITEWRSRIMQSSFVPSTSNFMDILEFSELIKE